MFYMVEALQHVNDTTRFMRIPLQYCYFLEATLTDIGESG
jgi:hypothetical protein